MTPPAKRATRVLFWDIDGTLLVTGRAGLIAWEQAYLEQSGGRPFPPVRPDGLTDHQIAAWLLGHEDHTSTPGADLQARAAAMVARYEAGLGPALPLRQGRVLDHVEAILDVLPSLPFIHASWLVTGNTRAGATAKLAHYGLDRFFRPADDLSAPLAGEFSERVEPRARIVERALAAVRRRRPDLHPSEALVIGDTPHDIEGAHAIGVPVLAVASNTHAIDELQALKPWHAVPALPAPDAFTALLLTER